MTISGPRFRIPRRFRDRYGLVALALYAGLSAAFFGRSLSAGLNSLHLGRGNDPSFLMWALTWWPYAIAHRVNPFLCRLIWRPDGFNLAWSGAIPLASIVFAPVTARYGPIVSYNALALACPAIASWCGFLLCRRVCGHYWPAILGGYVFGFSSYILGQMIGGHLNLLFVFPAPILVSLALMRLDGELGAAAFVTLAALTLAAEFLLSIELAAGMVLFAGVAIAVAFGLGDRRLREALERLAVSLALAGIAAAFALSPYLYYLFAFGAPHGAINSPGAFSADLVNFVVPTRTVGIGAIEPVIAISSRFPGNLGEAGAYLSLPVLAVVLMCAIVRWRELPVRILVTAFGAICILAIGPRLHIAGWVGFGMPWKIFTHAPALRNALPVRLMNYAELCAAAIVSLWLADKAISPALRAGAASLIVLMTLPNPASSLWSAAAGVPAFFSGQEYRQYIRPGETLIALPYGIAGNTMLWQAETAMYFNMAGGYTGITPRGFERWPIVDALLTGTLIPDAAMQLRAFMAAHRAAAALASDDALPLWAPILAAIDPAPAHVGGISIYRLPPSDFRAYSDAEVLELQRRNNEARFAALLSAAQAWLNRGGDPASLTPKRAQASGLLPPEWVRDPDVRTNNGLYLGAWSGGKIAVGVVGSYDALTPLLSRYRDYAAEVLFPFPKELSGPPRGDAFMRQLVIVFDRPALARAAAISRRAEPSS
jgi:hypothetical protein